MNAAVSHGVDLPETSSDHTIQYVADNVDHNLGTLDGRNTFRRSDREWAGLPTDLVIEQELMRGLKSAGGLTRGSGMGEQERLLWCLGMPACAEVSSVLQSLTGGHFSTGSDQHRQHKEMGKTR